MSFEYTYATGELAGILAAVISTLPTSILGIATYVLTALALQTMAKNRGLSKSWLAWIPVVNVWLLGSLSDQYQYVVRGKYRAKRRWLLILNILKVGLTAVLTGIALAMGIKGMIGSLGGMADLLDLTALLAVACGGISITYMLLYFMALYDVYTSMDPDTNTLFLVLSILIPVTKPFFLFFCRNKESGMPPRRACEPQEPWEQENSDYL